MWIKVEKEQKKVDNFFLLFFDDCQLRKNHPKSSQNRNF